MISVTFNIKLCKIDSLDEVIRVAAKMDCLVNFTPSVGMEFGEITKPMGKVTWHFPLNVVTVAYVENDLSKVSLKPHFIVHLQSLTDFNKGFKTMDDMKQALVEGFPKFGTWEFE